MRGETKIPGFGLAGQVCQNIFEILNFYNSRINFFFELVEKQDFQKFSRKFLEKVDFSQKFQKFSWKKQNQP